MQKTCDAIRAVASTNATVLIVGRDRHRKGAGGPRALHDMSRQSGGPYVALNCASMSPTLIESELFGHERGSFTGACDGIRVSSSRRPAARCCWTK